ncbi:DUF4232 domain-containing protein [Kitasatospora acidiphila]
MLVFTNPSTTACTLTGYPGISYVTQKECSPATPPTAHPAMSPP